MNLDKEISQKIQEIQVLEHQLQTFLAQKQNIQLELNEIENAMNELSKTEEDVYKILAGILMKSDKKRLQEDLKNRKKLSEMEINSIEKQEKLIEKRMDSIKKEINETIKKNK